MEKKGEKGDNKFPNSEAHMMTKIFVLFHFFRAKCLQVLTLTQLSSSGGFLFLNLAFAKPISVTENKGRYKLKKNMKKKIKHTWL